MKPNDWVDDWQKANEFERFLRLSRWDKQLAAESDSKRRHKMRVLAYAEFEDEWSRLTRLLYGHTGNDCCG